MASSILLEFAGVDDEWLFIAVALLASIAFIFLLLFLEPIGENGEEELEGEDIDQKTVTRRTLATLEMSFSNPRAMFLAPMSIAYGFTILFVAL